MFYVVHILSTERRNLLIPSYWCFGINIENTINDGINRNKKRLIFYSEDQSKNPDFLLPVSTMFNEELDACYHGHIIKFFGNLTKLS